MILPFKLEFIESSVYEHCFPVYGMHSDCYRSPTTAPAAPRQQRKYVGLPVPEVGPPFNPGFSDRKEVLGTKRSIAFRKI